VTAIENEYHFLIARAMREGDSKLENLLRKRAAEHGIWIDPELAALPVRGKQSIRS